MVFSSLDDMRKTGGLTLIILSLLSIFVSGLFFGIFYFAMDVTETSLRANNFPIHNNVFFSDSDGMWELSVYPFLALRELFIWGSFFFIFALTLGLLVVGYQSGKSPVFLGMFIVFVIVVTYFGVEFSNVYRSMLEVELFREMMLPFAVYNRVMLNFPWFSFLVGLLSTMLGIVNYQRTGVNQIPTSDELNY